jgi:hypothetical protein
MPELAGERDHQVRQQAGTVTSRRTWPASVDISSETEWWAGGLYVLGTGASRASTTSCAAARDAKGPGETASMSAQDDLVRLFAGDGSTGS